MKAAIFDMDGTVLDSMSYWRNLNIEFLTAYLDECGIAVDDALRQTVMQLTGLQATKFFEERFGLRPDYESLSKQSCDAMRAHYATGLPPKPGIVGYLKHLGRSGTLRVLATATPTELAHFALQKSGLADHFDLVTTTQMIGLDKSAPAFWLRVAALSKTAPEQCTVFEDALYAIEGARKAGIPVIAIADETNVDDRAAILPLSTRLIESYDELY